MTIMTKVIVKFVTFSTGDRGFSIFMMVISNLRNARERYHAI
ncbi:MULTISPECIES: hypothetical protein [Chroococcidiopsis]|nr:MULTISPECIES: hypothetical protein [Chroococcidiopsis]